MSDRTQKIPEGCPEGQYVREIWLNERGYYQVKELAPLPDPSEHEPEPDPEIVSRTSPSPLAALYETEEWKSAWDGEPSQVTDKREIPACAAIRYGQVIIAGKRHHDCLRMASAVALKKESAEQGFMTTHGNFVNRLAGFALVQNAGMKSADPDGFRGIELFSEDLY